MPVPGVGQGTSYPLIRNKKNRLAAVSCEPGGIRTPNLLIRSQVLYPVKLRVHGIPARGMVCRNRWQNYGIIRFNRLFHLSYLSRNPFHLVCGARVC